AFDLARFEDKYSRKRMVQDMYRGVFEGFGPVASLELIKESLGLKTSTATTIGEVLDDIPEEVIQKTYESIFGEANSDCAQFVSLYDSYYLVALETLKSKFPIKDGVLQKSEFTVELNAILSPFFEAVSNEQKEEALDRLEREVQSMRLFPATDRELITAFLKKMAYDIADSMLNMGMPKDDAFRTALYRQEMKRYWKVSPNKIPQFMAEGIANRLDAFTKLSDAPRQGPGSAASAGLGIGVSPDPQGIYVNLVVEGSPADKEKFFQKGDILVAIQDIQPERRRLRQPKGYTQLNEYSFADRIAILKGAKSTGRQVEVFVKRPGEKELLHQTVSRGIYKSPETKKMVEVSEIKVSGKRMASIKIRAFGENMTTGVVRSMRDQFGDDIEKLDGILLDLRFNPGGLVTQAAELSALFIGDFPTTIMNLIGNGERRIMLYKDRRGEGIWGKIPLVIMLNGRSASASELISIALQDYHRAVLVGRRTIGKGSAYTQASISQRSGIPFTNQLLQITSSYYFSPGGRSIHGRGIQPDIELSEDLGFKVVNRDYQENHPRFLGRLNDLPVKTYEVFDTFDRTGPLDFNLSQNLADAIESCDLTGGQFDVMLSDLKEKSLMRLSRGLNEKSPTEDAELNEGLAILVDQASFIKEKSAEGGLQ
ncbi:MAG: S41 family peptidase, partial [Pseudomonadota bacterium]